MRVRDGLVALVGLLALSAAASAVLAQRATPWPNFQANLKPAETTSPRKASIPNLDPIVPPGPDVSIALRSLSGHWSGFMCGKAACSAEVRVDTLTADGGTFTYAFADERTPNFVAKLTAKVKNGNELRGTLADGSWVTIRARPDGNLDILFERGGSGSGWASGLLVRKAS